MMPNMRRSHADLTDSTSNGRTARSAYGTAIRCALAIAIVGGCARSPASPANQAHGLTTHEPIERPPVHAAANLRGRELAARPKRPEMHAVAPGVLRGEIVLTWNTGSTSKLWIYLPDAGGRAILDRSLPVVLIASSAGTDGLTGAVPTEADEAEHIPWARAGFAVVAYELDGALPETDVSAQDYLKAIRSFRDTGGGLLNLLEADKVAKDLYPEIDADRVVLVGSGSAGTVALNAARTTSMRKWVRAVVVFSPKLDVVGALEKPLLDALEAQQPGIARFAREASPGLVPEQLKVPTFLFETREGDAASIERYADAMRAAGQRPQLIVSDGDPYVAMVREGIDLAIVWTQRGLAGEASDQRSDDRK
jgi:dienelactone hydrolase